MIAFNGVDVGCLLRRVERLRMFEFPTIFCAEVIAVGRRGFLLLE